MKRKAAATIGIGVDVSGWPDKLSLGKASRGVCRRAAITDRANRNSFSALARASSSGMTAATPGVSAPGGPALNQVQGQDHRADLLMLPGGRTLDAIYQLLTPQTVAPQQAWGGYYVFDVPKPVQGRRADQPLSIIVRTGAEQHRFPATLRWK